MTLTTTKWTIEDYHQIVATGILAGRRVELLQGDIIEIAPEEPEHAYLADNTSKYLTRLLGEQAQVRDSKSITLSPDSEPEPDISVVRLLGAVYRQRHPYPGNIFWLIEFAQTNVAKDLKPKRITYAAASVPEYWVVNLKARQVRVFHHPESGDYQHETSFRSGVIAPLAFFDVAVSVAPLIGESTL